MGVGGAVLGVLAVDDGGDAGEVLFVGFLFFEELEGGVVEHLVVLKTHGGGIMESIIMELEYGGE